MPTLATVYLTACQGDASSPVAVEERPSPAPIAAISDARGTPQTEIARHVAVVLEDATVRSALRDAVRASLLQEHKLDVHEFFLNGPRRVRELLSANGLEASARVLLGRSGSMDLYFPIEGQMETWKGEPVTVVTVSDPDARVGTAIDARGKSRMVSEKDIPSLGHVVVIHPAEKRFLRSLASFSSFESTPTATCAGGPGDVRITYFRVFRNDGPFGGANEMEFRGGQFNSSGTLISGVTVYAVGGIRTNRDYFPNVSLGCVGLFGDVFGHAMWEMDGGSSSPNQNDFFGTRFFPPTAYNSAAVYNDGSQDGGIATISNP